MDHEDIAFKTQKEAIEKFREVVRLYLQDETDDAAVRAIALIKMIFGAFPRQYQCDNTLYDVMEVSSASNEIEYAQENGEVFLISETFY